MLKASPSNKKDNTKSSKHSIDENKNQKPIYSFYKKIQGAEVEVTEFIENKIVSRSQNQHTMDQKEDHLFIDDDDDDDSDCETDTSVESDEKGEKIDKNENNETKEDIDYKSINN